MNLNGLMILIVEDEPVIALVLEDKLRDRGARTLLASTFDDATQAVLKSAVDAALLDINLHGEQSYPLAYLLRERGTPFIFVTGYGDVLHPPEFANVRTITKPYDVSELDRALTAMLGPRA